MHLRDYLHDISLRLLKRIAVRLGITVEYQARIKLMNAIDRAFWDGALVSRLIGFLTDEERRVLSIIAFSFDSGVREEELAKKAGIRPGAGAPVLNGIIGEFILISLVAGVCDSETRFVCPRGVAEQVRRILISGIVALKNPSKPVPPAPVPALLEDIYALLAAAYRAPLPLTLKGQIRKNVLERAFAGSPVGREQHSRFFAVHRDALVLAYLGERGILLYGPRTAYISPVLDGWLGMSMTARMQDIAAFSFRYFLSDGATMSPFVGILGELPAGASMNHADLALFLHERTTAAGTLPRLRTKTRQALCALEYLGLLRCEDDRYIMTETGERVFRGDPHPLDGIVSRTFTLQPNFEVIVGPELDPRVRFTLELMSECKKRDIILTNIMNRAGIARARERGMSVAEMLNFFETHSRTPLPQNVRFSIENWANAYGNVSFAPAMLMRFRDAATCESVMHIPEIAPFIRERLSDTALTVPAEHIRTIAALLRRSGYLPEISGEAADNPARSGKPYRPATIRDLIDVLDLPEHHRAFVSPEDPDAAVQ